MPYFKTEPGLPQTHLEGNRLVLTCLAEGSWPLEFKWLRNDSEVAAYSSEYRYGARWPAAVSERPPRAGGTGACAVVFQSRGGGGIEHALRRGSLADSGCIAHT